MSGLGNVKSSEIPGTPNSSILSSCAGNACGKWIYK